MDPDLKRLLSLPGDDDLTAAAVAEIFQVDSTTIIRAVNAGHIITKRHPGRGTGARLAIRIPRIAVLIYLVRIYEGSKSLILEDIAKHCKPECLPFAREAAGIETRRLHAPERASKSGSRRASSPLLDHPDLFEICP